MAKEPIIASTTRTAQPNAGETKKDQKSYQITGEYDENTARLINQEFDRLHERINKVVTESLSDGEVIEDLAGTATLAEVITRVNLIAEIMRNSGGIRRTK